jgi:hypothetical protein
LCDAVSCHGFIFSVGSECFRFHWTFNLLRFFFDCNIYLHVTQMRIRRSVCGNLLQCDIVFKCNTMYYENSIHPPSSSLNIPFA